MFIRGFESATIDFPELAKEMIQFLEQQGVTNPSIILEIQDKYGEVIYSKEIS